MTRLRRSQSKYASIVPGLPELPVAADAQQKIDFVKTAMLDKYPELDTTQGLMKHYAALRQKQDELSREQSAIYLALEAITQLIVDSHKHGDEGWGAYGATPNTLIASNGDRLRIDIEPYAQCIDKDANREWAIKEGLARLLLLPWQTLNMLTKKRLLAGEGEPPGVKTFKKRTIVYTPMKEATEPVESVEEWSPDTDTNNPF